MSGYEFDVFISYTRRGGSSCMWVRNHFHEKLVDCLGDQLGAAPRVFMDRRMDRGVHWPTELESALRRSKILIPIYTPPYFRSEWCLAEWHSMRQREELLGLATGVRPHGLIYPVLHSDSNNFPDYARERSWWDFKLLNSPDPVFQQSLDWLEFHRKVEQVAIELADVLPQVPEWQPDWPIKRVTPAMPPHVPIPRF